MVPCKETKTFHAIRPTKTIKERTKQLRGFKFHHNTVHKRNITGKQMLENMTVLALWQSTSLMSLCTN